VSAQHVLIFLDQITSDGYIPVMPNMAGTFYLGYLLALATLPLLVMWRWGLAASLVVSVAELGLVVLLFLWLPPPNPYPVGYPIEPGESPLLQIRRSQAHGYAMLIIFGMFPAIAALIGAGLSAAWWVVQAAWRFAGGWLKTEGP
jgi:hypothetical protein